MAKPPGTGRAQVVVTGVGTGIGRATAARLVEDGYGVVGVDRDADALERVSAELGLAAVEGDIAGWDTHERAADRAAAEGELVGWVNNAAVEWAGAAHEIDAAHVDRGLRVLLNGPIYGMCVAVRRMLARRRGSIVNLGSVQGAVGFPRYPVYAAAKAGVAMATRQVAVDYAAHGIRANALLPGVIDTPMAREALDPELDLDPALAIARESEIAPVGRPGDPSEMAAAVAFLLSDESSFVTGAVLVADGGLTAQAIPSPPLDLTRSAPVS